MGHELSAPTSKQGGKCHQSENEGNELKLVGVLAHKCEAELNEDNWGEHQVKRKLGTIGLENQRGCKPAGRYDRTKDHL